MAKNLFCDNCGFIAEYEMALDKLFKSCRQCGKKEEYNEDIDIIETFEKIKYRQNIAYDPTLQRIVYKCDICDGKPTEMSIILQPENNKEIRICNECKTFFIRKKYYCIYCQAEKDMIEIINERMKKHMKICDICNKPQ